MSNKSFLNIKMKYNNLLIISGSGRNSGKTTFACKVIEKFRSLGIISIKISPHFHKPSEGPMKVISGPGFEIYTETSIISSKDSSRMLKSGAKKVFYIQAKEESIQIAFSEIYAGIQAGSPVICESPALINYIEPGLYVHMISPDNANPKTTFDLKRTADLEYKIDELTASELPIDFVGGKWKYLK
jgi:hypothetical protein